MASTVPPGRLGTAQEVANFATRLLSEEARYISGSIFLIDGEFNAYVHCSADHDIQR
jgi:NAD(P)-dependent dehydrogenase (short-subunit alcohol dehydrogenase family)